MSEPNINAPGMDSDPPGALSFEFINFMQTYNRLCYLIYESLSEF